MKNGKGPTRRIARSGPQSSRECISLPTASQGIPGNPGTETGLTTEITEDGERVKENPSPYLLWFDIGFRAVSAG